MNYLRHGWESALEVRDDGAEGDGRTLVGLAVPFEVELDVSDLWDRYTEVFRKGSFAKTIRDRKQAVPLFFGHDRQRVALGKATSLVETEEGLAAEFHLTDGHPEADLVLTAVRDGTLAGLSIGFEPNAGGDKLVPAMKRQPPMDRDLVIRTAVTLREISLCNFPAYTDAGVTGVRAASTHPSLSSLAAERERLDGLRSGALDRWGRVVRR